MASNCALISFAAHAEDATVEVVFSRPGELRVKARANFQKATHAAVDLDLTMRWLRNAA